MRILERSSGDVNGARVAAYSSEVADILKTVKTRVAAEKKGSRTKEMM